jgi:DNA polymerase
MFVAAPGHDLIASDYSAIEAVVLAELAGEKWRQEVFRTHGKIYEMSASKISGVPFEEMMEHRKRTGQHHPLRKTIGKVAELASGYQGWVGAWKAFGADEFMSEEEMKTAILKWRAESPNIVEFWGGQTRRLPFGGSVQEYYGIEGAAISAVLVSGQEFSHRGVTYFCQGDVLYCRLLSGRYLTYHRPRLEPSQKRFGEHSLSYEGWNTNPKNGPIGWIRMQTWGGRLVENLVQATARDIQREALVRQERAGYKIVLHVYDENVAEVPEGWGSVEEFEMIMSTMPAWAADWPVRAAGGWRGKRYRKD